MHENTMIDTIECHLCHRADTPQHLKHVRSDGGEGFHAHPACIDRHNRTARKQLRAWDASALAGYIFNCDLDATSSYDVERFFREHADYPKDYLSGRRPSVAAITAAGWAMRTRERKESLSKRLEEEIAPWPAKPSPDTAAWIAEDIKQIFIDEYGMTDTQETSHAASLAIAATSIRKFRAALEAAGETYTRADPRDPVFERIETVEAWPAEAAADFIANLAADLGKIERREAQHAAWLLIEMTAFRKYEIELEAGRKEWEESEEGRNEEAASLIGAAS
jgi:hypothetical protein